MKEVNLNFAFKALDGIEINESNAGKTLANVLSEDNGSNPIKFFSWAKEFYDGKTVKLDGQDIELLKNFIIASQRITALVKAQILEVINKD